MKKSGNYQRLRASFLTAALLASGALNGQHALAQTAPAPATAIGAPSELDEIVVTGTHHQRDDHADVFCGYGG